MGDAQEDRNGQVCWCSPDVSAHSCPRCTGFAGRRGQPRNHVEPSQCAPELQYQPSAPLPDGSGQSPRSGQRCRARFVHLRNGRSRFGLQVGGRRCGRRLFAAVVEVGVHDRPGAAANAERKSRSSCDGADLKLTAVRLDPDVDDAEVMSFGAGESERIW